ncbi:unnamed protein product [Caenorhabditis brenneri]
MDDRFYLFCVTLSFLAPSVVAFLEYFQSHLNSRKKSSFKLLKLPWLAFQEVLKSMDHSDIFMLSLCSKNTLNILKIQKTKVNWLCFLDDKNELSVYSRHNFDSKDLVFFARTIPNSHRGVGENRLKVVRLGGTDVQCLWEKFGTNSINVFKKVFERVNFHSSKNYGIECIDTNRAVVQQALENYIHEIFTVKCIELAVTAKDYLKKNYRNISGVTDLTLSDVKIEIKELEEMLEMHPDLISIRIDRYLCGPLSVDSQIFNIDNVLLYQYFRSAPFFWQNFKGRYLAIGRGVYNEWDVIEFVRSWISGTKYPHLKLLVATKEGRRLNFQWILNQLRVSTKEWNRPPIHEYWSR